MQTRKPEFMQGRPNLYFQCRTGGLVHILEDRPEHGSIRIITLVLMFPFHCDEWPSVNYPVLSSCTLYPIIFSLLCIILLFL